LNFQLSLVVQQIQGLDLCCASTAQVHNQTLRSNDLLR